MQARLGTFAALLAVLDVVVIFGLGLPDRTARASAATTPADPVSPEPPAGDQPQDPGWALCLTSFAGKPVDPVTVAITYLDTGLDTGPDSSLTPNDVRRWFGELDGRIVDVYKLEQSNGRRRVSFEIARGRWPGWDRVARGYTGKALCSVVRAALVAAGVGRPADGRNVAAPFADDPDAVQDGASDLEASRHGFEFLYVRRPTFYRSIEWVGTLDHVLDLDRFAELQAWLAAGDVP